MGVLGGIPAGEHLEPGDPARGDVDLLLIKRYEFLRGHPGAQRQFQRTTIAQFALHRRFEPAIGVLAVILGVIHRGIGHVQQHLGIDGQLMMRQAIGCVDV